MGVTCTPLFSRGVVSGEIKDRYLIILVRVSLALVGIMLLHCSLSPQCM